MMVPPLMNDSDKVYMHYVYDDVGNLIQTANAKSLMIAYTYDGANRMLNEEYQDAAYITLDVADHYDFVPSDYPPVGKHKGKIYPWWKTFRVRGYSIMASKKTEFGR